jgi:N-methylhydantoinase B/oxoprolinase/acetone carboxylase alpha subunit
MAGTLITDTLQGATLTDGTNSTSTTNCIRGSAKAWVNFNGTSSTIRASYNVSSVSLDGTGLYTINFTNPLADANYAVSGSATFDTGGTAAARILAPRGNVYTTTALSLRSSNDAGGVNNCEFVSVSVFR